MTDDLPVKATGSRSTPAWPAAGARSGADPSPTARYDAGPTLVATRIAFPW